MKAVIYAFKWRAPGMMQIISDIYERIFPALTAGPNVLVQFDWSTSVSRRTEREDIQTLKTKSQKKQRKLLNPFSSLWRDSARNSVLDCPRLIMLGRQ